MTLAVTIPDATSWTKGAYLAYLSPWGAGSLAQGTDYWDSLTLSDDLFPNSVTMTWKWPDTPPTASGVYNFNAISFGNYYGSVVQTPITPLQVNSIGTLTQTQSVTLGGDASKYNVITDFWLTERASDFSNRLFEVEVFDHAPAISSSWANSLMQLGTYTGSGHTWQVALRSGSISDIVFLPKDTPDVLTGSIDIKGMLDWLVSHHVITGNEYFNGLAMGVEVIQGTGSIAINKFNVDYGEISSAPAQMPVGSVTSTEGASPPAATSATSTNLIPPLTIGTAGDDTISIGTDVPADSASTATVYGGFGNDLITMKALKAAFIVIGGEGSDLITVQNTGATFITGGNLVGFDQTLDGADSITVNGSGGNIAIFSNLGNDTVSATGLQDATTIQIYGGKGSDTITENNVTAIGKNSIFIAGGEDGDTISATGNGGALTIYGGISSADSTDGADAITIGRGSTGALNVFANGGNDTVTIGTLGADSTNTAIVYGGGGADSITIAGQTATSQALTVIGNEGADIFAIAKGAGQTVTIADFTLGAGGDSLKLTSFGGTPGPLQMIGGSYQTLQQSLDAAANASGGTVGQSKAAAVAFDGSTYVVIEQGGAGFQPGTDQAIKLTGVTDLVGLISVTTVAA